jgi:UDPglucose 6-dehydrogenase
VLLTEWAQFRDADPEMMGWLVRQRKVVDGRHALDADAYRAAGWEYRALGRPVAPQTVELSTSEADSIDLTVQVDLAAELLQGGAPVAQPA